MSSSYITMFNQNVILNGINFLQAFSLLRAAGGQRADAGGSRDLRNRAHAGRVFQRGKCVIERRVHVTSDYTRACNKQDFDRARLSKRDRRVLSHVRHGVSLARRAKEGFFSACPVFAKFCVTAGDGLLLLVEKRAPGGH